MFERILQYLFLVLFLALFSHCQDNIEETGFGVSQEATEQDENVPNSADSAKNDRLSLTRHYDDLFRPGDGVGMRFFINKINNALSKYYNASLPEEVTQTPKNLDETLKLLKREYVSTLSASIQIGSRNPTSGPLAAVTITISRLLLAINQLLQLLALSFESVSLVITNFVGSSLDTLLSGFLKFPNLVLASLKSSPLGLDGDFLDEIERKLVFCQGALTQPFFNYAVSEIGTCVTDEINTAVELVTVVGNQLAKIFAQVVDVLDSVEDISSERVLEALVRMVTGEVFGLLPQLSLDLVKVVGFVVEVVPRVLLCYNDIFFGGIHGLFSIVYNFVECELTSADNFATSFIAKLIAESGTYLYGFL